MSLNSNTEVGLINTTGNQGTISLPPASSSQGRVITFKDAVGRFGVNALTLVCDASGSDTFEDGSTSKVLREANGIIQVVASGTVWYVLTGTQQNSVTVSTLQALSLSSVSISSGNLLVSSLQYDALVPIYQQSSLVYFNSNVFAGSRVYPATGLNRYTPTFIFNPNSICNLSFWFDASVSTSMAVSTNSTILFWNSLSTTTTVPTSIRNTLTVSTPINIISNTGRYAPNSLNGLGGVNLSTSFLTTNTLVNQAQNLYYYNNNTNSEFTNICVINRLFAGNPAANPALHAIQMGGNVRITLNAGGIEGAVYTGFMGGQPFFNILAGYNPLCNTPSILLLTRNTVTMTVRLNGIATTSNYSSGLFGTNNFQFMFGTNTYNQYYSGNLHEFIQYQRALSSDEIFKLEGYLAWKYAIQSNLIASHPYRYIPPY